MTASLAAALVFALACAVVIAFQIGLALGAPWGAYAMGGAYPGRYPPAMRISAAVLALVMAVLALIVLSDAGVVLSGLADSFPWLVWVAVAVSGVSVVLNAITRSTVERRLWLPVATVMLVSSLIVALT